METTNDKKVLELKEQIKEKKKSLAKVKFSPTTNCMLPGLLGSQVTNINTLDLNGLKLHRAILKNLIQDEDLILGAYKVSEWIGDIEDKIAQLANNKKAKELSDLESKLSNLLSSEAKVTLEINAVESLLGSL